METKLFLIIFGVLVTLSRSYGKDRPPNILLIVADDLGIGDVGCFGNNSIRTPNLDRLATEGAKLTHHLAAASICTPSRAALMTGRYPIRIGMAPKNFFRVNFFLSSASGLPSSEVTIGEIAKESGYHTGFIGKWHLGLHCRSSKDFCHHPNKQGFDYYYGLPLTNLRDFGDDCISVIRAKFPFIDNFLFSVLLGGTMFAYFLNKAHIIERLGVAILMVLFISPVAFVYSLIYGMPYWNGVVMRNLDVVEQPIDLNRFTSMMVAEGSEFIKKHSKDDRPFLLVMSLIQVHTALHASDPFKGRSEHGPYGDEVEEMDWSIGRLLNVLDTLGIAEDTFVYFTSDNGGHVEEKGIHGNREGGWNGIFRGGKGQGGMDGGIRVPTLLRWPGVIQPGSVIDVPTSMMDVLPTVTKLINGKLPTDRIIDGVDISSLLKQDGNHVTPPHDFLVHYCCQNIHAARYTPGNGSDVYKVHFATPKWDSGTEGCGLFCDCHDKAITWQNPPLMFNIARDPSERSPINPKSTTYKEMLEEIEKHLKDHRRSLLLGESQFDVWKIAPRPWLQPCCNFPTCTCRDNKRSGQ